ncbi:MAG: hypothetical protein ACI8PZ_005863 [Myxococcota bacterium]|jgi:hypothetical protein
MYQRRPAAPPSVDAASAVTHRPKTSDISNQDAQAGLEMQTSEPSFLLSLDAGILPPAVIPPGGPPTLFLKFMTTAPTQGAIVDLDSGGVLAPDTQWVQVSAGATLWLDVGSLSDKDRDQVMDWLVAARGTLTLDGRTLVLGEPIEALGFGADTEDPQAVLDAANQRVNEDMDVWAFLNGGSSALTPDEADRDGWTPKQDKPGAWYNGYQIVDGEVVPHQSDFDPMKGKEGGEAPDLDLDGLKALIMRSMDVGGVRDALGDNHDVFVQALRERFGAENPLGESGFAGLCDELWTYLQTGAGIDGNVDIGRLQAIVRALSPDTKATADTNTPFEGEEFTPAGSEVALKRGDGVFGRATMMSLMHLFGEFSRTVRLPPKVGLVPDAAFNDSDHIVRDRSGSMMGNISTPGGKWPKVESAVDQSQGWTPGVDGIDTRTVGSFDHNDVTVGTTSVTDMEDALKRAYTKLYPKDERKDQKAFAGLFALKRGDIFDSAGLNAASLMRQLGDGTRAGFGAAGESPLKAMLLVLMNPGLLPVGNPLRTRLELGKNDPNTDPVRLNGIADEPEQSLEYLQLVKALADALGVDARLIFVPTRKADYDVDPVGNLLFVDLDDIVINADATATVTYTQGGSERTEPIGIEHGGVEGDPGRFKGASLELSALQRIEGIME